MTVTAMRPNKPSRYRMGPDGRTHLIEDEDQSSATPAIPSPDVIATLKLLADQVAFKKCVAEFADASDKARDVAEEVKTARAELTRLNREIETVEKRHADKLAGDLAAHTAELEKRSSAVEQRERAADKCERELDELAAKLKADRAKLDRKLAAVREAAGE